MTKANIGYHAVAVGDITVTALNDGQFEAPFDWVWGVEAVDVERQLASSFRPVPMRITLNGFLVESAGRKVLIDTGAGGKFGPEMGKIAGHLRTLGVEPNEIDMVLLTHAHPDHVGGLTDDKGEAIYPFAELVVNAAEHEFWTDQDNAAQASGDAEVAFKIATDAFAAYSSRTRLISDGDEVLPGITAKLLPGHTIGHTGYEVRSGSSSLLVWGDIAHFPGIQFADPEAGMLFDFDREVTKTTRLKILEEVSTSGVMITGMHLDFPTFGHVVRELDHYQFIPIVWSPTA